MQVKLRKYSGSGVCVVEIRMMLRLAKEEGTTRFYFKRLTAFCNAFRLTSTG
jgi:hypothetical protein